MMKVMNADVLQDDYFRRRILPKAKKPKGKEEGICDKKSNKKHVRSLNEKTKARDLNKNCNKELCRGESKIIVKME